MMKPKGFPENVHVDTYSVIHLSHYSWYSFVMIILFFQESVDNFHHSACPSSSYHVDVYPESQRVSSLIVNVS